MNIRHDERDDLHKFKNFWILCTGAVPTLSSLPCLRWFQVDGSRPCGPASTPWVKRESPPACHLAETISYTLGPGISLQNFCHFLHFSNSSRRIPFIKKETVYQVNHLILNDEYKPIQIFQRLSVFRKMLLQTKVAFDMAFTSTGRFKECLNIQRWHFEIHFTISCGFLKLFSPSQAAYWISDEDRRAVLRYIIIIQYKLFPIIDLVACGFLRLLYLYLN